MSKSTRAEEARAQAQRLREEQERAAKRQRVMAITLVVVGLVVVGGLVAWILSQQPESRRDFTDVAEPLAEVTMPATASAEGGIPVAQSGVAGEDPADAVEVAVYLDFMCPACGEFERMSGPTLAELRQAGDVVVEYRPIAILDGASRGTEFSSRAAAATGYVADQAPEHVVAFIDAMFVNQPAQNTSGLSDEDMARIAREAGVPDDVAAGIEDGTYFLGEEGFADWATALTVQASRDLDPIGTPTIVVDGASLERWDPASLTAAVDEARA